MQSDRPVVEELERWLLDTRAPKLERNHHSRLHDLSSSIPALQEVHSFLVQHDWAAVFENAVDYDGGHINLPYPECAFELRISGKSLIAIVIQTSLEQPPVLVAVFARFNGVWIKWRVPKHHLGYNTSADLPAPMALVMNEIKAVCVALDAGVANYSTVAASAKENRRREAHGKVPFVSYHVVDLSIRSASRWRPATQPLPVAMRLHFRRGHWRHFNDGSKTWIRWTLVGDPDLGFIGKEYRL